MAPQPLEACPELQGLQAWGALHSFIASAPGAIASAATAATNYVVATLSAGAAATAAASAAGLKALVWPVVVLLAWLARTILSYAGLLLLGAASFVAWQIVFPSRLLIRWVSRHPYCRGVTFDLPPAPDQPGGRNPKYLALTIDGGPCPYRGGAVLDALRDAGARATFFITGSAVEECDWMGVGCQATGGEGLLLIGSETLKRMVLEGHELANNTWTTEPSHTLSFSELTQQVSDTHRVLSQARHAARAALTNDDDSDAFPSHPALPASATSRSKWFRPVCNRQGWFTPAMVDAAQRLGYKTVLGSVWPWFDAVSSPLLNALYIAGQAYPGAVIVMHDRSEHLLPTLKWVVPWLTWLGYEFVTLSEAASRSKGLGSELTPAALEVHNLTHNSSGGAADAGVAAAAAAKPYGGSSAKSLDSSGNALTASPAYLARMAKERERAAAHAAIEEAERGRLKAAKRAEADRRAGINRELANMSAAEKRGLERREREKKEAEARRARRKVEEAKARERHEAYVKAQAEKAVREAAEAERKARKAAEDEVRRKAAEEERIARKEAERKAAEDMVRRQRAEAALAKAGIAPGSTGAAAALAAAGIAVSSGSSERSGTVPGSEAGDSSADASSSSMSAVGGGEGRDKRGGRGGGGLGFLRRIGSKAALRLTGRDKGGEGSEAATDEADTAVVEPLAAEMQVPEDSFYGWYGHTPEPASEAALARIDAALAAHAAGAPLPAPAAGAAHVWGPCSRVMLDFEGLPLLVSQAGEGAGTRTTLLTGRGEPLVGPGGEKMVLLLGANNMPLADPHGRPVFVAEEAGSGRLLGVHPDGSIIRVPPPCPTPPASVSDDQEARRERRRERSSSRPRSDSRHRSSGGGGSSGQHRSSSGSGSSGHRRTGSGSGSQHRSSSSRNSSSHAQSHSRSHSSAEHGQKRADRDSRRPKDSTGSTGSQQRPDAGRTSGGGGEITPATPTAASLDSSSGGGGLDARAVAAAAAATAVDRTSWVPARLLLGPSGKPLLGLDNRPLIVAVDAEGMPLVMRPDGSPLLGPYGAPLHLALSSDGGLVALDNLCRPLQGADGTPRVVALDKRGRPMANESGWAVLLSLSPTGFPITEPLTPSLARSSAPGSAAAATASPAKPRTPAPSAAASPLRPASLAAASPHKPHHHHQQQQGAAGAGEEEGTFTFSKPVATVATAAGGVGAASSLAASSRSTVLFTPPRPAETAAAAAPAASAAARELSFSGAGAETSPSQQAVPPAVLLAGGDAAPLASEEAVRHRPPQAEAAAAEVSYAVFGAGSAPHHAADARRRQGQQQQGQQQQGQQQEQVVFEKVQLSSTGLHLTAHATSHS